MKSLPAIPITFEEFLEWCDSETRAEWVNGKVVLMSPASRAHQEILLFLTTLMSIYVRRRGLGQVLPPFLMRMRSILRAREPDVLYISPERLARVGATYMEGVADLAVEIVSPESVERDRVEKMDEYAATGVREYWVIDPKRQTADFYSLGAEGRFQPIPLTDEGVFHSRVVDGFFLRVNWLWQDPMPDPLDILRGFGITNAE